MNWVIVVFLAMIIATLTLGGWITVRQERAARRITKWAGPIPRRTPTGDAE